MKQKNLTFIHICRSFLFFFLLFLFSNGSTINVVNHCGFTVWPGIYSSHGVNITGFQLTSGNSRSFQTLPNWSGSLWGRTGCTFNGSGHGLCKTGDCGSGEMECNGRLPTSPVTVAGFDFSAEDGDFYNVRLNNGYNLQMTIEPTSRSANYSQNCLKIGCVYDLNKRCPKELRMEGGVGCNAPCQVFGTSEYCCNSLDTYPSIMCKPTPYTRLFNLACPRPLYGTESNGYFCYNDGEYFTVRFCPPQFNYKAVSTIKLGNQLNYDDQLFSISGKFTLGFFGEEYQYLGIWYTDDAEARKVWVANPNNPIRFARGVIALSIELDTGDLIITDDSGRTLMNFTDVEAGEIENVSATLEDTGNFRLINEINKKVLWQSFDHPTNVLLPGMKLGYNKRTRRNWTLTSGTFTLGWEPSDQRLVIQRRGEPYWTSGFLDEKTFEYMSLTDGAEQSIYNLSSVYNNEEQYFSYTANSTDPFPMWILTPKGQITNYNISKPWTPELCYGYNSSNGCIHSSSLPLCRRKGDYFSYRSFSLNTRNITDSNSSISISDCFFKCWNDCGCLAYNSTNTDGTGCVIWIGSNELFVDVGGNSTMKYVISSQNPNKSWKQHRKKNLKPIWTLLAVPLFLGLGLLWNMKKRKQKRKEYKRRKRDDYFLELAASESFKNVHQLESDDCYGEILLFSFASIMAATHDFSTENKLGQGGYGPVYKGILDDGREIAIKRLSRSSGQGLVEFKNELILIAKLQHTNLVRILGCCIHREEKMLVYEYMPNKSLDFFLFDENKKAKLEWPKRFNIIEGIAQGLLYLHKYSRMRVIHRDLKSNNILLDESMNPKISDFGMARIFGQNESQATTNRVVGTYGYMSPEYAMEGTFSIKSDIYSFGVLILEIISGRRNSSFVHLDRTFNLLGYAWELWRRGNAMELEDPTLGSTCVEQQFLRTLHVALLCVQERAVDRPTTSDMISMLLNETVSLPSPKTPAFFTHIAESNSTLDQIKPEDCSLNNTTMSSILEGR